MIGDMIRFVLSDFPILMLALALLCSAITLLRGHSSRSAHDIFVGYILFFCVGFGGIWGFVYHAFFPEIAAKFIGWANSPFQFEVAVANLGIGMAGLFALRASRGYHIATTIFVTCFFWGAAVGHIVQMLSAANFAPGNSGAIFIDDILLPLLLIIFLLWGRKK